MTDKLQLINYYDQLYTVRVSGRRARARWRPDSPVESGESLHTDDASKSLLPQAPALGSHNKLLNGSAESGR